MQHILRKIQIIMCEGSSHIIFVLSPAISEFDELRNNQIVAAVATWKWAHHIVYTLTSINGKDHIVHILIGELHYLIVKEHTISGQGKSKMLILRLLNASAISDKLFDYFEIK